MEKPLTTIVTSSILRGKLEARYWPKVGRQGENECWLWLAKAKHPYGYGRMSAGRNVQLKAHQIAWALENGPIPDGLSVLHECDNPSCCNPHHLFLGTQKANIEDAVQKGRASRPPIRRGADHHNTKLTNGQIASIRADLRPAPALADLYGVSTKTIYRIRWGHRTES